MQNIFFVRTTQINVIIAGNSMEGAHQIDYEHSHEMDSQFNRKGGAPKFSGVEPEKEDIMRKLEDEEKCKFGVR